MTCVTRFEMVEDKPKRCQEINWLGSSSLRALPDEKIKKYKKRAARVRLARDRPCSRRCPSFGLTHVKELDLGKLNLSRQSCIFFLSIVSPTPVRVLSGVCRGRRCRGWTGCGLGVGSIGHFEDSNSALPPCFAAAVSRCPSLALVLRSASRDGS